MQNKIRPDLQACINKYLLSDLLLKPILKILFSVFSLGFFIRPEFPKIFHKYTAKLYNLLNVSCPTSLFTPNT